MSSQIAAPPVTTVLLRRSRARSAVDHLLRGDPPAHLRVFACDIEETVGLFIQLNWGRTAFSLRWAVPLCWAVLVAAVASLAIALMRIVIVKSVGEDYEGTALILVGWGLWLITICAAVLCITAAIVATQIGSASDAQAGTSRSNRAPAWRWAAIISSAVILVIALFNGYKPTRVSIGAGESSTATQTQTVTAAPKTITAAVPVRPGSRAAIPAEATPLTS